MNKEVKTMRKKGKLIGCYLIITGLLFSGILTTVNADDWVTFRHDVGNTGASTSSGIDIAELAWTLDIPKRCFHEGVISEGNLYLTFETNSATNVYCLEVDTGELIWKYKTLGYPKSGVTIAEDKVFLYDSHDFLYCLDAMGNDDGTTTEYYVDEISDVSLYSELTIVDDMIYVQGKDLYCIDTTIGISEEDRLIWTYDTETPVTSQIRTPAVVNGRVYSAAKKNLYCVDAEGNSDGTTDLLWEMTMDSTVGQPVIINNKVYFGSSGGVFCLDAVGDVGTHTTEIIWSDTGVVAYNPLVVTTNHVFLHDTDADAILCLDAQGNPDGTTDVLWQFTPTSYWWDIMFLSAAQGGTNVVYVVTENYKQLYCLAAEGNPDQTTDLLWNTTFQSAGDNDVFSCIGNNGELIITQTHGTKMITNILCYQQDTLLDSAPVVEAPEKVNVGVKAQFDIEGYVGFDDQKQVYYSADWGDGTSTGWMGPYDYDVDPYTLSITHQWELPGNYPVTFKAKDTYGAHSEETKIFFRVNRIDLGPISGGLGISFPITNDGDISKDVYWTVELVGGTFPGFHVNKFFNGTVFVKAGETELVSIPAMLALGKADIVVTAECGTEPVITESAEAFILFFYVMITG